jgi:hypothetical protein
MPKEWYEGWADELDEGGVVLQRSASKANLEDGPKSANIGDIGGQGYNSADLTASVGAPSGPVRRVPDAARVLMFVMANSEDGRRVPNPLFFGDGRVNRRTPGPSLNQTLLIR